LFGSPSLLRKEYLGNSSCHISRQSRNGVVM
jgi:hypothetical protein